jgi:DNA recombination-dependent growth factor C
MPALSGSLTYARLFVDSELSADFRERFMEAIQLRVMRPLSADEDLAERSGWSTLGDPYELDLSYERVFYNDFLNLGFRTDRWAIPASLVRTHVRETEAAYREKKGRERLSKRERAEIKEVVLRKLRKQSVPQVRVVDLSWSLNEGVVRFFSHSARPTAAMIDLFFKTFGLKLVPESPYTLAERIGLSEQDEKLWDALTPTLLGSLVEA